MANPQGKGLVPILDQLNSLQPQRLAKPAEKILGDYFVSLLILSASFSFKPALGQTYYLYRKAQRWQLSLIAPQQWTSEVAGDFVGSCHLQADMTWQLQADSQLADNPSLCEALERFHEGFIESISAEQPLEQQLPWFRENLPFYQRVSAHALAKSLHHSIVFGGLADTSGQLWLERAPTTQLLTHPKNQN